MYGFRGEEDWANVGVEVEPEGKRKGRERRESVETIRSQGVREDEVREKVVLEEERTVEEVKVALESVEEATGENDGEVNDEGDADDEGINLRKPKGCVSLGSRLPRSKRLTRSPRRRRHRPHRPRKEVFIPLNSDTEFLTLLAQALASLAALQTTQKHQFASSVDLLAREVSHVSSPSRPKSDLYIWREIFTLWVEAQIFESQREKDRGERSVEDAEEKLEWFVDQVAKRKLAKKMRHKESRTALEKFIKLNVELLHMKRFQIANEEAARKIVRPSPVSPRRSLTPSSKAKEA